MELVIRGCALSQSKGEKAKHNFVNFYDDDTQSTIGVSTDVVIPEAMMKKDTTYVITGRIMPKKNFDGSLTFYVSAREVVELQKKN